MKYCNYCGSQIMDDAVVCPRCGCAVTPNRENPNPTGAPMGGPVNSPMGYPMNNPMNNPMDVPSTGLNVLAFLFPLIGLILYLIDKDKTPIKCKEIGKWALIGFCVGIGLSILTTIITSCAAYSSYRYLYTELLYFK